MPRIVGALVVGLFACNGGQPAPAPPPTTEPDRATEHARQTVLDAMRADEGARLSAHDFAGSPPWSEASGANPFLVRRVGPDRFVGASRASGTIEVLDAAGERIGEPIAGVPGITGWAWNGESSFFAVGEASRRVHAFELRGDAVVAVGAWPVKGVDALRDVALGSEQRLYLADAHRDRVLVVSAPRRGTDGELAPREVGACEGALHVVRVADVLLANCMLEHRVRLFGVGDDGLPDGREAAIEHDGPTWAIDARAVEGGLEIAVAGVEDHPLDRKDGSFGFVDSFVFVYTVRGEPWSVTRTAEINVGEHGVVTPKWVRWQDDGRIATSGYGSAAGALVDAARAQVQTIAVPPGITALAGSFEAGLAADPLLDAWIVLGGDGWSARALAHDDTRSAKVRLGEALVFTTLMAPAGSSTGKLSRFTCETCHFEGNGDGRTHHTGRGDVHATTKTIRGLFGNRPHFTRALDRTTTAMIDNEFSVASRGTPADPWFTLRAEDHPWLSSLGVDGTWSPEELRRAMFEFLVTFTPDRNPAVLDATAFTERQRRGAALFLEHCESCHQARLRSDDPQSRVPPEAWERHVLGSGAILWASDERTKTGVEPYVHDEGARVPSLRRLWVKRPYFTNGSAPDLAAVLARVDLGPPFRHDAADDNPLSPDDQEALRAFLDLL